MFISFASTLIYGIAVAFGCRLWHREEVRELKAKIEALN